MFSGHGGGWGWGKGHSGPSWAPPWQNWQAGYQSWGPEEESYQGGGSWESQFARPPPPSLHEEVTEPLRTSCVAVDPEPPRRVKIKRWWMSDKAAGQYFVGECFDKAMKQLEQHKMPFSDEEKERYRFMYSRECDCVPCKAKERQHELQLRSEVRRVERPTRESGLDAPPQSEAHPDRDDNLVQEPLQPWTASQIQHARNRNLLSLHQAASSSSTAIRQESNEFSERQEGNQFQGQKSKEDEEAAKYWARGISTVKTADGLKWKTQRYAVRSEVMRQILFRLNEEAPKIDAFADAHNNRYRRFWGQGGERPDAWQEDWNQDKVGTLWCNPPFTDILEVVNKVDADEARIILVAPDWPEFDYYAPMWTNCKKSYYFPEGTVMFELDGAVQQPTRWPVWALVLDGKKQHELKQQALPRKKTKSSRRRYRRQLEEEAKMAKWDEEQL